MKHMKKKQKKGKKIIQKKRKNNDKNGDKTNYHSTSTKFLKNDGTAVANLNKTKESAEKKEKRKQK